MRLTKKAYREYLSQIEWHNAREKESAEAGGFPPHYIISQSWESWKAEQIEIEKCFSGAKLHILR